MVKDFPILFRPHMRAILERRMTQTRRIPNRFNAKWQVGDHLWVREHWRTLEQYDGLSPSDVPAGTPVAYLAGPQSKDERSRVFGEWRQSIFMPRWVSRLTLVLLEVREQRLQEITPEDAEAEGILNPCGYYCDVHIGHVDHHGTIRAYERLWDSINAKRGYPWEGNPIVRAFTFKVVSSHEN